MSYEQPDASHIVSAAVAAAEDAIASADLVTVANVEIFATGIEYDLASGPTTFTPEDLVDAVAAQDDPAIPQPRIWLGHTDETRFHGERGHGEVAPIVGSGEPAVGKVGRMWLSEDEQTVLGDLLGVPRWLADILASAYPSRSIEGNFAVETVTGHEWRFVVTGLALLGVVMPGVKTIEDIQVLFSEDGPEVEVIEAFESTGGETVGAQAQAVTAVRARATTAAVNADDVRRAYYETLGPDQMWWWVRAMYLDPNELIVDDDQGQLFRVPFTISGEEVEFSDPVEVKITFVDQASGSGSTPERRAVALVSAAGREAAVYASRSESRPESTTEEDSGMTPEQIRLLRQRLSLTEEQLPDDATEDQINAALAETPEPTPTPEPEPTPTPEPEPEPEPVAASDSVTVPAAEWARVQAGAQAGTRIAEEQEISYRDSTIEAAVGDGKIPPSARESYRNLHGRNRDSFVQLLTADVAAGGLAPNLIPVNERGRDVSTEDATAAASSYDPSWLSPQERARAEGKSMEAAESRVHQEV